MIAGLRITGWRNALVAQEKQRGSRETKKPKKVVPKANASAPSTKGAVATAVKKGDRS